jgi:hypothetical protein
MRFHARHFRKFGSDINMRPDDRTAAASNPGRPLPTQLQTRISPVKSGFAEATSSRDFQERDCGPNFRVNRTVKMFAAWLVFCLAAGAAEIAASPHPRASLQKEKGAPSATLPAVLTPDKGKFRILVNGQAVGDEEFEISRSGDTWTAHGSTTAHVPGGADIKAEGQLKLSVDGSPIRYQWSAEAQKKATGIVDFDNGTAKCSANLGTASPLMKDFKFATQHIAVLDNNLYHQYAVLSQIYDWKAGGKQTFPVVIPQDLTPGSISVEAIGPQQVENGTFEALRVSSTDLEILLYLDASHHLVRLDVPSSKVTIQRE